MKLTSALQKRLLQGALFRVEFLILRGDMQIRLDALHDALIRTIFDLQVKVERGLPLLEVGNSW